MRTVQVTDFRRNLHGELSHLAKTAEPIALARRDERVAVLSAAGKGRKPLLDLEVVAAFCRKHAVRRFYLFGSILRDDFGERSDVDVMVDVGGPFSDLSTVAAMSRELCEMFGRKVDLVSKHNVEEGNVRARYRDEILKTASLVYDAT